MTEQNDPAWFKCVLCDQVWEYNEDGVGIGVKYDGETLHVVPIPEGDKAVCIRCEVDMLPENKDEGAGILSVRSVLLHSKES